MERLLRLLRERPALSKVYVAVVRGEPVTLEQLVRLAMAGDREALTAVQRLGDPPREELLRRLAARFFKELPPDIVIGILGPIGAVLTPQQAAEEIERNGSLAPILLDIYRELLEEVFRCLRS